MRRSSGWRWTPQDARSSTSWPSEAAAKTPNGTKFQKTLGLNDFYWGAADADFPLGHIQMLGKSDRTILRGGAPRFAPGIALDYLAKHCWTCGSPPRISIQTTA
jgi:hypothetical protein